jgi:hypothetical protein
MFEAHSCGVLSAIHEQSPDINQGVERKKPEEQGAGDQGMMFGYACRDTDNYMPLALDLSHMLLQELAAIRREKNSKMPYLRPDAKSQVTIEYNDDHTPKRIDAIVVSTQHDDFDKEAKMLAKIKKDVIEILMPRVKKQLPKRVQALFGKDILPHQPHRQIRDRWPAWRYRPHRPQDHRGHLRRQGRTRWRCLQWQGPQQGGPQCRLCRPPRGQAPGGRRCLR